MTVKIHNFDKPKSCKTCPFINIVCSSTDDCPIEEEVIAEWVPREIYPTGYVVPHCSNCGMASKDIFESRYCPNCGAKMKI